MISVERKKEFSDKVNTVLAVINNRVQAQRLPVAVEIDRNEIFAQIYIVPLHFMGQANKDGFMVWIDKSSQEIRWVRN